jgi:hypothetical protein
MFFLSFITFKEVILYQKMGEYQSTVKPNTHAGNKETRSRVYFVVLLASKTSLTRKRHLA